MSRVSRLSFVVLALVAGSALFLGGCSDDGSGTRSASGSGSGSASGSGSGSDSGSEAEAEAECEPVNDDVEADSEVDVSLTEFSVTADPAETDAGQVKFNAANEGGEAHELVVVKGTEADLPVDDDGAAVEDELPDGAFIGEIEPFAGGSSCEGVFELEAGDYVLFCNLTEETDDGVESHLAEGMITEFSVG